MVKRKKLDEASAIERLIVTGLVTSTPYLKEIASVYNPDFLTSEYCRQVANWAVAYYNEFGQAPGMHMQDLFDAHRQDGALGDQEDLIEALLVSISEAYEEAGFNPEYISKRTERYFQSRSLMLLAEDVKGMVAKGEADEALAAMNNFRPVRRASTEWVDPLVDEKAMDAVFEDLEGLELFTVPGVLGDMLGPQERDNFLCICGPEKRGKTWWLLAFTMWALAARRNVAFFSVGDMSKRQMLDRVYTYITRASRKKAGRTIWKPVLDCRHNQACECEREECPKNQDPVATWKAKLSTWEYAKPKDYPNHVTCTYCQKEAPDEFVGATWAEEFKIPTMTRDKIQAAAERMKKRAGSRAFRMEAFPAGTLSIRGIESCLDIWEKEGFIPDVVVVDYFDILAAINSKKDERHQVNETWMAGRALAQKRCCLLITATQAKLGGHSKARLEVEDAGSEDKRKLSHVTQLIALNQTPQEKARGIMNISELIKREDDYDVRRMVTVHQCLAIGRPYLTSYEYKGDRK